MEPIQEADGDEQNGIPTCQKQLTEVINKKCRERVTHNAFRYLSQAVADPRNNLGHKDAASAYFLSTIK